MTLSVANLKKLKPNPDGRNDLWVLDEEGLSVRVRQSGSKNWYMKFRDPGGRLRPLLLGPVDLSGQELEGEPVIGQPLSPPAARLLAKTILRDRKRGRDVFADREAEKRRRELALDDASRNSFTACARAYIEQERRKKDRNRRWRDTARVLGLAYAEGTDEPTLIKGGLAERWRDRSISTISPDDLHSVMDEAHSTATPGLKPQHPGPSDGRARVLAVALGAMFTWLARKRRVPINPATSLDKPRLPKPRERVLTPSELRWFWQACEHVGGPFAPVGKLLLLTAQRRDEVASMRWSELSDDLAMWSLPAERTKNGRPHLVPLTESHRAIIGTVPRMARCDFVFTTTTRSALSGFSKWKEALDVRMLHLAKAEAAERGDDPTAVAIPGWRLHDLRRTAATLMSEHCDVLPHVVESILNHISTGHKASVAGTYNRALYLDQRRVALEALASYVQAVAAGGNVVPLRGRA